MNRLDGFNNRQDCRGANSRAANAIRQNMTLIILTTTVHWSQPLQDWQNPHFHSTPEAELKKTRHHMAMQDR